MSKDYWYIVGKTCKCEKLEKAHKGIDKEMLLSIFNGLPMRCIDCGIMWIHKK